jgi:hypothetical protein
MFPEMRSMYMTARVGDASERDPGFRHAKVRACIGVYPALGAGILRTIKDR